MIEPPPDRTAGDWAEASRILPADAPEPGPFNVGRTPWFIPIYDAIARGLEFGAGATRERIRAETITIVCGAQMGKTETLFNLIGHRLDDGPAGPVMYVGPTEKQVRSMSTDRIDKMLRGCPSLWRKTAKGRKFGTFEKWVGGARLGFAWAGSGTELRSHPASLAVIDERDAMKAIVGEGDPVGLVRARVKNYPGGVVIIASTPTIEGVSPIWKLLVSGTFHCWAWRCLHCAQYFVPRLSLLKFDKTLPPLEMEKTAGVACEHCGAMHWEAEKQQLNDAGTMIPHELDDDGKPRPVESPRPTRDFSFWISGLAGYWQSFGALAVRYVNALKSADDDTIQTAINTDFGECFKVSGQAPDWAEVAACRRDYTALTIPPGCKIITAGVDVQKYGLYYVIRGWGAATESWLLDHGYFAGETEYDDVWIALGLTLQREIGDKRISRMFVDSGYRPGDKNRRPDHAVYSFARRWRGSAFPTKGHDTQDAPLYMRPIDITAGGKLIKGGANLWHINTDFFKRWIHSRVSWPDDQPGGWHLHRDATEDYCRQIVAEELIIKPSGRFFWLRTQADNHYFDCEVLATAAAWSINAHQLRAVDVQQAPPQTDPAGSDRGGRGGYGRKKLF